ncbi:hypothetical protein K32_08450 [Kaistia sp. 32K]|uniref:methyltransferase domain-containing protein n=1 Tax=Kaistia sp. 32K TaxID=2795690 RepID=UPI0019162BB2|nr:methyltransferase domain-containing protein [Kaistia sp. 32K]BCP52228.1 hypothetical protein K32_08450 [Kaistia sp. 32K]
MSVYCLSQDAGRLVALLSNSATEEQFVARFVSRKYGSASEGRRLLEWAIQSELVQFDGPNVQPAVFTEAYSSWRSQRGMLADETRTRLFGQAIAAQCKPGTVAIDVGAGSGILSLFAARAGARKVYALELTSMIEDATQIASDNGFSDRITFIKGDATKFSAPEPVDLIFSEWAGMYLIDEYRHFDAFCQVRDRYLKPSGIALPGSASIYIAPIDNSQLYTERGFGFWKKPVHGFDFSVAESRQLAAPRRIIVEARPSSLLGEYKLRSFDCKTDQSSEFFFETEFVHRFEADGACHGFIGYFDLELAPGIVINTSPYSKLTHWQQSYLPIEEIFATAGDELHVKVKTYVDPLFASAMMELTVSVIGSGERAPRTYLYPIDNSYS